MIAALSPAKPLDFECVTPAPRPTKPAFEAEASELLSVLRRKTRPQLRELMKISETLADVNFQRYKTWSPGGSEDNARAALFAFRGDVYTGFELEEYGKEDISFAQKHLRILSGLYGALRPLDLIQAYRLEMGTQLKTVKGSNLYDFWDEKVTKSINSAIRKSGGETLINLASKEYFSVLQPDKSNAEVITPQFKQKKEKQYISMQETKMRKILCQLLKLILGCRNKLSSHLLYIKGFLSCVSILV